MADVWLYFSWVRFIVFKVKVYTHLSIKHIDGEIWQQYLYLVIFFNDKLTDGGTDKTQCVSLMPIKCAECLSFLIKYVHMWYFGMF